MMTRQEYYDLLVRSALDGTFPCGYDCGCYYRDHHDAHSKRRCAIGVLIPDGMYAPSMEGKTLNSLLASYPFVRQYFPEGMDEGDMTEVQAAHDQWAINKTTYTAEKFITRLNKLPCFKNVVHRNPQEA